jgi:hypothetical protein
MLLNHKLLLSCLIVLFADLSQCVGEDTLLHSYRAIVQFSMSSISKELDFSEEQQAKLSQVMGTAKSVSFRVDDIVLSEKGLEEYLVKTGLAAASTEPYFQSVWKTTFTDEQRKKAIGMYLTSYGLRGMQNPAVQEFLKVTAEQKEKLQAELKSAAEVDRKRWAMPDANDLPANTMCMHLRLGLAERVLSHEQMLRLTGLINDPQNKSMVRFTLGL